MGRRSSSKAKISRVSIVDQVCASIKEDIAAGMWLPGDKLPSEAEFADLFGVNRLSVRMALQKLSTLGIIETRVGEGSFVVERFSLRPFLSEIAFVYDSDEKYREVQQLRNLLEGECMNLAILNATQEEKEELHAVLERYDQDLAAYTDDIDSVELLERLVDSDFNFHYKVVKMSHNALYKDIYYMVHQLIRRHITRLVSSRVRRRKEAGLPPMTGNDSHTHMYESILNGDRAEAQKAREEMLGILPVEGLDFFEGED